MLGCAPCLQSVLHQLVEPYTTNRHYRCCCCLQTCTATLSVSSGASRPRARTSRECATSASQRWQVSCLWCKTGCMADCLIGIRQTHLRANAWVQEHSHAPVMSCTSVKGWCISRSVRAAHLKHDRIPQCSATLSCQCWDLFVDLFRTALCVLQVTTLCGPAGQCTLTSRASSSMQGGVKQHQGGCCVLCCVL